MIKGLKKVFAIGLSAITLTACIDHEVIPAPVQRAELECSFQGNIGNAFIQYTEHVNGYTSNPDIATQSAQGTTTAQYMFDMASNQDAQYVRVALGSISWNDATGTTQPALNIFNSFFLSNANPNYSTNALNGFEVTFHAANGITWKSNQNSTNAQNVSFTSIEQESDVDGDYSKFICNFDCYVYHTDPITSTTDSIQITNAVYRGWFKR